MLPGGRLILEGIVQEQNAARMEFHVSREARDRYRFDESLFTLTGNVIFANFHAARVFAQRMNERRDLVSFPEQAVKDSARTITINNRFIRSPR